MKNNDEALGTFMGNVERIREQLAELQEYIDNHLCVYPEYVDWSTVGITENVINNLDEIIDFLLLGKDNINWEKIINSE